MMIMGGEKPSSDVVGLFKSLISVVDTSKIKLSLESYRGDDSKYFKTLMNNIGDDLGKYKYVFDLVLKINKENPKTTFHDIYFKFLSTSKFEKYRDFWVFLNKLVVDENAEILTYDEEDNDSHYNNIMSNLDVVSGIKLLKDFVSQRSLTFEEFYYQKYLSNTEKLVNTLENVVDVNELYYRYPWFIGTITSKIYISSSNHDIDVFISNINAPVVYKDKSWYKPNNLFYNFLSNQKNVRSLKSGDIPSLDFTDDKGKVIYSFHILYKVLKNDFRFSFVVLDDSVFALEKKFLAVDYDTCCDEFHVNMFLDDDRMYSQGNIELVLEYFNKAMANIQSSYKIGFSVLKLPSLKNIRTLRELAKKVAEITVYLHLDAISNSIFKKRVIRNYYKESMLFELKVEEKLPELLYNVEHKSVVSEYLYNSIESEVFNIGESVYRLSRKSMFKPLVKKKTHHPSLVLKYIDEVDNHNYTFYVKKEKWLLIKDILSGKIHDDEYVTDVIFPRMNEIYDVEKVMTRGVKMEDFEKKYSLVFSLLEDVMSKEELLERHKDMFLYYPDPVYDDGMEKEIEEKVEKEEEEIAKDEVKEVREEVKDVKQEVRVADAEVKEEVKEKVKDEVKDERVDNLKNELLKEIEALNEEEKKNCYYCGTEPSHLTTTTYLHSFENQKKVKSITACYKCLETNNLTDL